MLTYRVFGALGRRCTVSHTRLCKSLADQFAEWTASYSLVEHSLPQTDSMQLRLQGSVYHGRCVGISTQLRHVLCFTALFRKWGGRKHLCWSVGWSQTLCWSGVTATNVSVCGEIANIVLVWGGRKHSFWFVGWSQTLF